MSTQFSSNPAYDATQCTAVSDVIASFALATDTELTYTVPGTDAQKYRALFSYGADAEVWFALNSTAQKPAAGTMYTSRRSELNPSVRYVKAGDVLHFISGAAAVGSVSLLSIPG